MFGLGNQIATDLNAALMPAGSGNDLHRDVLEKVKKHIDNDGQKDPHLFDNDLSADTFDGWKKLLKRKLMRKVIEFCRTNSGNFHTFEIPAAPYGTIRTVDADGRVTVTAAPQANDPISNAEWPHYVAAIRLTEPSAPKDLKAKAIDAGIAIGKDMLKTLSPWEPDVWDVGSRNGRILFSDEEEMTYRFKGGATERYRNFKNRMLAADESEIISILEKL